MDWTGTRTLVTRGASFICSHVVQALLDRGASVRVVDNLSSGRTEYLHDLDVEFLEGDLLDHGLARRAVSGIDVVSHLAADHGGRGYVDLHQAACAQLLDWEPQVPFVDGLHRTIDWYFETKDPAHVAARFETALTER